MTPELLATLLTLIVGGFALAVIGGLVTLVTEGIRSIARCIEAEADRLRAHAEDVHEQRLLAADEERRRPSVRPAVGYRTPGL